MFSHERLDVYQAALAFVAWTHSLCRGLNGMDRHPRDQILRASQSIPLNIAEGSGKRPGADRIRFLQIAYGSALECAAALDVLVVCGSVPLEGVAEGKALLERIVSMLVRMTDRADGVREEPIVYGN